MWGTLGSSFPDTGPAGAGPGGSGDERPGRRPFGEFDDVGGAATDERSGRSPVDDTGDVRDDQRARGGRPRRPEDYVRRSLARAQGRPVEPEPRPEPPDTGWGEFADLGDARGRAAYDEGWPAEAEPVDEDFGFDPVGEAGYDPVVRDPLDTGPVDSTRVDPVDVARAAIHQARGQTPPARSGSPEVRGSDSPRARRSGAGAAPRAWSSPATGTPTTGRGGGRPAGRPASPGGRPGSGGRAAPAGGGAGRPGGGAGSPARRPGPAARQSPPSARQPAPRQSPPASRPRPATSPPGGTPAAGGVPRGRAAWAPAPSGRVGSLPPAPEEGEIRMGRRKRRRFGKGS